MKDPDVTWRMRCGRVRVAPCVGTRRCKAASCRARSSCSRRAASGFSPRRRRTSRGPPRHGTGAGRRRRRISRQSAVYTAALRGCACTACRLLQTQLTGAILAIVDDRRRRHNDQPLPAAGRAHPPRRPIPSTLGSTAANAVANARACLRSGAWRAVIYTFLYVCICVYICIYMCVARCWMGARRPLGCC
jgi:hypothetical protein